MWEHFNTSQQLHESRKLFERAHRYTTTRLDSNAV